MAGWLDGWEELAAWLVGWVLVPVDQGFGVLGRTGTCKRAVRHYCIVRVC